MGKSSTCSRPSKSCCWDLDDRIGDGLLRDAILRTLQVAEIAGIRALLVHAISDAAKGYYERRGFVSSPVDSMTVMITVAEAAKILTAHGL